MADLQSSLSSLSWLQLESIIPLESKSAETDVKRITNLSRDTVKRRYAKWVVQLSERREGMKLRNALKIADGE